MVATTMLTVELHDSYSGGTSALVLGTFARVRIANGNLYATDEHDHQTTLAHQHSSGEWYPVSHAFGSYDEVAIYPA